MICRILLVIVLFFIEFSSIHLFFPSKRWHTIYLGDWSSDVCSSDLAMPAQPSLPVICLVIGLVGWAGMARLVRGQEIGRASSRERVYMFAVLLLLLNRKLF